MTYKVQLPIFEGPLDLLLHLIKEDELNIYDIPIAKVTRQYMEYLEMLKMLDINIAGEFLVMASTLMHIKSKMLLPTPAVETETGDPREELVLQLLEYKRFKDVAEQLQHMEVKQSQLFKRTVNDEIIPAGDDGFIHDVDIFDLMSAFKRIWDNLPKETDYRIAKETVTVPEMMKFLLDHLESKESVRFEALFIEQTSRVRAVAMFLGLLELIKRRIISVKQDNAFESILITRGEQYDGRTDEQSNRGSFAASAGQ